MPTVNCVMFDDDDEEIIPLVAERRYKRIIDAIERVLPNGHLCLDNIGLIDSDFTHDLIELINESTATSADFSFNDLTDLKSISKLKKLTTLIVTHNSLRDISSLKEMTKEKNLEHAIAKIITKEHV